MGGEDEMMKPAECTNTKVKLDAIAKIKTGIDLSFRCFIVLMMVLVVVETFVR